ncbi:amidohydrolase family protein [Endozoicomonas arenosclerae]|uniref:amidohydrolase family protein n=1 Tax=Endozoicomonas arenosclerae TaxID=1633495 RepID=UPI0007805611|nr:amidohydrolase family protein [Endozoicomonas arenosclerae]
MLEGLKIINRILPIIMVLLLALAAVVAIQIQLPAALPSPEPGLKLSNVELVIPGEPQSAPVSLEVKGQTISRVTSAETDKHDPYSGMYVMPGLIDMHAHWNHLPLPDQNELFAFLHLYHGVTTIRTMGDMKPGQSSELRTLISEGEMAGPNIVSCGRMIDGPDPVWDSSLVVDDPSDADRVVKKLSEQGNSCIKVYDHVKPDVLDSLRIAAHKYDMQLVGHVPHGMNAAEARLDDAQHLRGFPPAADNPDNYIEGRMQWLNMDEKRRKAFVKALVEQGGAVTPTLVTIERVLASKNRETMLADKANELLPHYYRDTLWDAEEGITAARFMDEAQIMAFETVLKEMQATVKELYEAGVPIHAGTDTMAPGVIPGASLIREIELLSESGLGPEQALASATTVPAEFLGEPVSFEPGATASFVIYRENPRENLAALNTIEAVIVDGRLYTRDMLDEQMKKYQKRYDAFVQQQVVQPALKFGVNQMVKEKLEQL